jgi:hypothetical protein
MHAGTPSSQRSEMDALHRGLPAVNTPPRGSAPEFGQSLARDGRNVKTVRVGVWATLGRRRGAVSGTSGLSSRRSKASRWSHFSAKVSRESLPRRRTRGRPPSIGGFLRCSDAADAPSRPSASARAVLYAAAEPVPLAPPPARSAPRQPQSVPRITQGVRAVTRKMGR